MKRRLIGEWKALVWLIRSLRDCYWRQPAGEIRCWWLSRPCLRCVGCGEWHAHYLITSGFCGPCSPEEHVDTDDGERDDEEDGVAVEAWMKGHEAGWHDCLAEINRQKINPAISSVDEQQARLNCEDDVPF